MLPPSFLRLYVHAVSTAASPFRWHSGDRATTWDNILQLTDDHMSLAREEQSPQKATLDKCLISLIGGLPATGNGRKLS